MNLELSYMPDQWLHSTSSLSLIFKHDFSDHMCCSELLFVFVLQILKPAFTILVDHSMKCFLLLIRGTHSIKDTLTAATGAVVPFHHSVVHEGGVSNLVLGYAHCGMVAAARWIAKLASPCLIKALGEYPGYKLKVELYFEIAIYLCSSIESSGGHCSIDGLEG